jgi:hypothetical protein
MTTAFAVSAASTAVQVAAILFLLAARNRRARLQQAAQRLYVAASANRAPRDAAARD